MDAAVLANRQRLTYIRVRTQERRMIGADRESGNYELDDDDDDDDDDDGLS